MPEDSKIHQISEFRRISRKNSEKHQAAFLDRLDPPPHVGPAHLCPRKGPGHDAFGETIDQEPPDGDNQLEVVEGQGTQRHGYLAHLLHGVLNHRDHSAQARQAAISAALDGGLQGILNHEFGGAKGRSDSVVQFPGDDASSNENIAIGILIWSAPNPLCDGMGWMRLGFWNIHATSASSLSTSRGQGTRSGQAGDTESPSPRWTI